jgi:hypothetical protein
MTEKNITEILDEVAQRAIEAESDERPRYRNRKLGSNPSQVYSIRIPVSQLNDLRKLAQRRGEAPSAMMRRWVLERLQSDAAALTPAEASTAGRSCAEAVFEGEPLRTGGTQWHVAAPTTSSGLDIGRRIQSERGRFEASHGS